MIIIPEYRRVTGHDKRTFGQKLSDAVANGYGSWPFIIIQSIIIVFWVIWNSIVLIYQFDKPPYIGLNLLLSLEAGYTGAFILMSQNRQAEKDRKIFSHTDREVGKIHKRLERLEKDRLDE